MAREPTNQPTNQPTNHGHPSVRDKPLASSNGCSSLRTVEGHTGGSGPLVGAGATWPRLSDINGCMTWLFVIAQRVEGDVMSKKCLQKGTWTNHEKIWERQNFGNIKKSQGQSSKLNIKKGFFKSWAFLTWLYLEDHPS